MGIHIITKNKPDATNLKQANLKTRIEIIPLIYTENIDTKR